ncbi:MAG TPA: hypothetical protein ENJ01_09795 [Gammaproteobacteria bacterium]|nr:hypothetical protein [Gammaproteobacteria bacterium]
MFYPLRPSPLFLVVFTSYLFWLASFGPLPFILVVTGFALIVPAYARYCFLVLDETANGHREPPVLGIELITPHEEWRAHKFSFIFLLGLSFIAWVWDSAGVIPGLILLTGFLAMIPAAIVVIAIEDRALRAIDPRVLLEIIHKLGGRYWLLTSLLWFVTPAIFYILVAQGWLLAGLMVFFYNLLVVCHWLGKAIYAHRAQFAFEPAISPERDAAFEEAERVRQRFRVLDRVYAQRRQPHALGELLRNIENEPHPLDAHAWYHEQMMQWDNLKLPLEHARRYINTLRDAGNLTRAATVIAHCQQVDENFTP